MASVWGELKRRNVVKVAVAYAIVGWLLIEVSTTVLPVFEAPDWIAQVFTFFILLGFPLALILSWAYEITPEGIKLERNITAGESITHVTGRKLDFVIIGLLVLAVGYMFVGNYLPESGPFAGAEIDPASLEVELDEPPSIAVEPAPAIAEEEQREVLPNSVAVLPFENLSPDPDNEYYAAGIHEEILNQLTKLSALNVIARTSMRQYANTEKSIPEIARELNVETVMEGSVRYANGQIRITAQLNDGVTGAHLWSETYTRDFDDIFAIESDIAMNVANALEAEFSLEEQERIERLPTDSTEAYALYLRAITSTRISSNTTPGASATFQRLLDQAIAVDPNFARAHAWKAVDYATSLIRTYPLSTAVTRADRERLALEHAEIALELDPNSGKAYGALAQLHRFNWRWAEARQAFERAVELNPNDVQILTQFAAFRSGIGEHEGAFDLGRRLLELNPEGALDFMTFLYWGAGELEAAVASARALIDSNPASPRNHAYLARFQAIRGYHEEALEALRLAETLMLQENPLARSQPQYWLAEIAYAYGRIGRAEDARRYFDALEAMSADYSVGAATWALAYLAIGDHEQSLHWLNVAADNRIADAGWRTLEELASNNRSDPVLDRPEFVEVRQRLGFTDL